MITCNCGKKFKTEKDWRQHFLLGRPSVIRQNRLLPWMTKEKELLAISEREEYDRKHKIIRRQGK